MWTYKAPTGRQHTVHVDVQSPYRQATYSTCRCTKPLQVGNIQYVWMYKAPTDRKHTVHVDVQSPYRQVTYSTCGCTKPLQAGNIQYMWMYKAPTGRQHTVRVDVQSPYRQEMQTVCMEHLVKVLLISGSLLHNNHQLVLHLNISCQPNDTHSLGYGIHAVICTLCDYYPCMYT